MSSSSSSKTKLLIFIIVASSVTSELLNATINQNLQDIKGPKQLADLTVSPQESAEVFIGLLNQISIEPVKAETYQEALKIIVAQSYFTQGKDSNTVDAELQDIEDNLIKGLKNNDSDIEVRLADSVNLVINLMKSNFIATVQANANGIKQFYDTSDRVNHLRINLINLLVREVNTKRISRDDYEKANKKVNEIIPKESPKVVALVNTYSVYSSFLTQPGNSFEAAIQAQIGMSENEIIALKDISLKNTDKIKEMISLWLSNSKNLHRGINLIQILLNDFIDIKKNAASIFGADLKAQGEKASWIFFDDLIRYIFSLMITDDANLINIAAKAASSYFAIQIPSYKDTNRDLFARFYNSQLKGNFNLGSDPMLIAFPNLQKYAGVIVAANTCSSLTAEDKKNLIDNFSGYSDLKPTELTALNLLQFYFFGAPAIDYTKNEGLFELMLFEFLQFIDSPVQSDLTQANIFESFDAFLASNIDESGQKAAIFGVLRIVNLFRSGANDVKAAIKLLSQIKSTDLAEHLESGLFDNAFKKMFSLVLNNENAEINALVSKANQAKDKQEFDNIKKEIDARKVKFAEDKKAFEEIKVPTADQKSAVFGKILALCSSENINASDKQLLI